MWTPSKIESRTTTLDLSASGQGRCKVRQAFCDDVVVCNAADHIDWSAETIQFELCEACLIAGCSTGGRVAIRRCDNHVLIIPDFAAMMRGNWDSIEYAPPRWMMKRGVLAFSQSDWDRFNAACLGAPRFEALMHASTTELLRLYHFQAPREFLFDYLSPSLAKWELILCTSGHDCEADIAHLKQFFCDPATFEGHQFYTPPPEGHTISVFLDQPSILEWPVFSSEPVRAIRLSDDIHFRPMPKC
jgi:hypothetical protein